MDNEPIYFAEILSTQWEVTRWFVGLSEIEKQELNRLWDAPWGILCDWIEDHRGKRSYYSILTWVRYRNV